MDLVIKRSNQKWTICLGNSGNLQWSDISMYANTYIHISFLNSRVEMQKVKAGNSTNWQYFKRVQSLLIGTPSVDFEEIIFDNTGNQFKNLDYYE